MAALRILQHSDSRPNILKGKQALKCIRIGITVLKIFIGSQSQIMFNNFPNILL